MRNSTISFLTLAIVFFATIYFIFMINSYENEVKRLNNQVEILYEDMENDSCIIDSLSNELDSLNYRYQMFDSEPGTTFIDILNAIIQVESRGNPKAHAKGEDAVGILQIRKCMVDDVNRILKKRGSSLRYTYSDRWDENKSKEMFDIFCTYYGLTSAEEMARCWNGGPRGINNPSTLSYWDKVLDEINS